MNEKTQSPWKRSLALAGASLILAVVMWAIVTWPLVTQVTKGIPASPKNPEMAPPLSLIAGDHLQLLYQFWLGYDTFFGPTPWSSNLYEFNVGDDAARRAYSTYYFPFNFLYGIGYAAGGHALGMNLTAVLSLAFSLGISVLWLRRWVPGNGWLVWSAAIIGQLLPYRWYTLMNGSPTGLALMWIPLILLGMDIWLRDRRALGAGLAGAAVFFAGWSDSHVFFFGALLAMLWLLPNFCMVLRGGRLNRSDILAWIRSSWPLWVWMGLVGWQVMAVKSSNEGTNLGGGRSLREVALFSPHWQDAVSARGFGGQTETYLGPWLLILLILGLILLTAKAWRGHRDARRHAIFLLFLLTALLGAALAATGPHNPFGDIWWVRLTRLLPPLSLIRQPAKIYLAFPPIIALMVALALSALPRRIMPAIVVPLTLLLGWTFTSGIHPRISLLPASNAAYHAVAVDQPRALAMAIPLWPGDSHWSSIYSYYAMEERLRLVNGYNPVRDLTYLDEIFNRYETLNQGDFSEDRLDGLLKRRVGYLILHENAFPEKVSPFSVGDTLLAMLEHPRLELLRQDGAVWAFRILPRGTTATRQHPLPSWRSFSAVWCWEVEAGTGSYSLIEGDSLFEHKAVLLDQPTSTVSFLHITTSFPRDRVLYLHASGPGRVAIDVQWDGITAPHTIELTTPGWDWYAIPLPRREGQAILDLSARPLGGAPALDLVLLGPTGWDPHLRGSRIIQAPELFHAGHTDLSDNSVHFLPEREPRAAILYGPALPLMAGTYEVELFLETDAPPGTVLGTLRLRHFLNLHREVPVRAHERTVLRWTHPQNALFNVEFDYSGAAEVHISRLELRPATEATP